MHCSQAPTTVKTVFATLLVLLLATATAALSSLRQDDGSVLIAQQYYMDAGCTQRNGTAQTFANDTCIVNPTDNTTTIRFLCEVGKTDCFYLNRYRDTGCTGGVVDHVLHRCGGCNPYYECTQDAVVSWTNCGDYQCSPCSTSNTLPINGSCSQDGVDAVVGYVACGNTIKESYFFNEGLNCASVDKYSSTTRLSGVCYYDDMAQSYAMLSC